MCVCLFGCLFVCLFVLAGPQLKKSNPVSTPSSYKNSGNCVILLVQDASPRDEYWELELDMKPVSLRLLQGLML